MNFRVKLFFYVESQVIMPAEELYDMENSILGRTYIQKIVDEAKSKMFYVVKKTTWDRNEFKKKINVVVEPVREEMDVQTDLIHIRDLLKQAFMGIPKVWINTKDGHEEVEL